MSHTLRPARRADQEALPSPQDRPSADVVIFDGHCRLCTAQARRLARWDHAQRLAFLSLHDPVVDLRYPDLPHEDLMQNMYVIDANGRKYCGAAAFRYLCARLPMLWWLAPLMFIPFSLPVWQFVYRQIANHRYRFGKLEPCDNEACAVHFDKRQRHI